LTNFNSVPLRGGLLRFLSGVGVICEIGPRLGRLLSVSPYGPKREMGDFQRTVFMPPCVGGHAFRAPPEGVLRP